MSEVEKQLELDYSEDFMIADWAKILNHF